VVVQPVERRIAEARDRHPVAVVGDVDVVGIAHEIGGERLGLAGALAVGPVAGDPVARGLVDQ
jgi:hypothetical protein